MSNIITVFEWVLNDLPGFPDSGMLHHPAILEFSGIRQSALGKR